MTDCSSVSEWLSSLKRGSERAAQKIWERYYRDLVQKAHLKLGHLPRGAGDEEDVAQDAFASFFCAVENGRFPKLNDRYDLWQVLIALADRRAKDRMRKEMADIRGGGQVRGGSAIEPSMLVGHEPTPETVDDISHLLREKWEAFEDQTLCKIAVDKLQGFSNEEIATRHSMSLRSVERKLNLTRSILMRETSE